jgi:hypothetical protein
LKFEIHGESYALQKWKQNSRRDWKLAKLKLAFKIFIFEFWNISAFIYVLFSIIYLSP